MGSGSERGEKRRIRPIRTGRARRVWMGMVGFGFLVGFVAFLIDLVSKVRRGGGGAIYESLRGQQLIYVGALVLIVLAPLVVLVAGLIRWWQGRELRDFEAKFRKRPPSRKAR